MKRFVVIFLLCLSAIICKAEDDWGWYMQTMYNLAPFQTQNTLSQSFVFGIGNITPLNTGTFGTSFGDNFQINGFANVHLGQGDIQTGNRTLELGNNLTDNGFSFGGSIGDDSTMQGNNGFWLGNPGVGSNAFNFFVSSNLFEPYNLYSGGYIQTNQGTNIALASANFLYEDANGKQWPGTFGSGLTFSGGTVTATGGGGGSSLYNPAFYTTNASSQITPVPQTTNQMMTNITANGVTNIWGGSGAGANNGTNVVYSTDGTNFYGPDFIQLTTGGNRTTLDKSGITSTSFNGNGGGLTALNASQLTSGTVPQQAINSLVLTNNNPVIKGMTTIPSTSNTPPLISYDVTNLSLSPTNLVLTWHVTTLYASSSAQNVISNIALPVSAGTNGMDTMVINGSAVSPNGTVAAFTVQPEVIIFTNGVTQGSIVVSNAVWAGLDAPGAFTINSSSTGNQFTETPASSTSTRFSFWGTEERDW